MPTTIIKKQLSMMLFLISTATGRYEQVIAPGCVPIGYYLVVMKFFEISCMPRIVNFYGPGTRWDINKKLSNKNTLINEAYSVFIWKKNLRVLGFTDGDIRILLKRKITISVVGNDFEVYEWKEIANVVGRLLRVNRVLEGNWEQVAETLNLYGVLNTCEDVREFLKAVQEE